MGCKRFILLLILISIISALDLELITKNLSKPIHLCSPLDNQDELYVVEQSGKIIKIDKEQELSVFLDIQDRVKRPTFPGDERGLLGMTFDPDYKNNKSFFINYIDKSENTVIAKMTYNIETDLFDEQILIKIKQPYSNHNGGHLEFGIDGYLYIAFGDGGSAGDPENNAQNLSNFFGKILRIDVRDKDYIIPKDNPFVNTMNAKPEIWAYGLRNPWKFSFDLSTNSIFIADVGQNSWEEINIQDATKGGINYGWNIMEGTHVYNKKADDLLNKDLLVNPIFEYPSDANYGKTLTGFRQSKNITGCSITGGYVYNGDQLENIKGQYFFSDYCTGKIWSINNFNSTDFEIIDWTEDLLENNKKQLYISSFGKDSRNNLYILDHNGALYKIVEELDR